MSLSRKIVIAVSAIMLAVSLVGAGFVVCILPPVTHGLASVFAHDNVSVYSKDQLVRVADATRDYSFGDHNLLALYETIYDVQREYSQEMAAQGNRLPAGFPGIVAGTDSGAASAGAAVAGAGAASTGAQGAAGTSAAASAGTTGAAGAGAAGAGAAAANVGTDSANAAGANAANAGAANAASAGATNTNAAGGYAATNEATAPSASQGIGASSSSASSASATTVTAPTGGGYAATSDTASATSAAGTAVAPNSVSSTGAAGASAAAETTNSPTTAPVGGGYAATSDASSAAAAANTASSASATTGVTGSSAATASSTKSATASSTAASSSAAPESSIERYVALFRSTSEAYAYSEETISHLDDCYGVATAAEPVLIVLAIFALIGCIYAGIRGGKRDVGGILLGAGVGVIAGFVALGVWAFIDFNGFFGAFHGVLFPQGNWTFPYDSLLICALPTEFWIGMGVVWFTVTILASILCIVAGLRLARRA